MLSKIKKQVIVVTVFIVSSIALGQAWYSYKTDPLRVYSGVWSGIGSFTIGDMKIDSKATLLIEPDKTRLSIINSHGDYNYTYDAELSLRRLYHQDTHLEVSNRSVNGLDNFILNTDILIPNQGTLLYGQLWRLEEGRIFLKMHVNNHQDVVYILEKTNS